MEPRKIWFSQIMGQKQDYSHTYWRQKLDSHQEQLRHKWRKVDGADFYRADSSLPTPVKLRWGLQTVARSMIYQPLDRNQIKPSQQNFLVGNNFYASSKYLSLKRTPLCKQLTMLVPIKKWLESVGRNFKWSDCNVTVLAFRGDLRARQTDKGGEKFKGQRLQRSRNRVTWDWVTCEVHIYDHTCTHWHKQHPDCMTTTEQLRFTE